MLLFTSIIMACPTLSYKAKVWLLSGFLIELSQQEVHVYMKFIACSCYSYNNKICNP